MLSKRQFITIALLFVTLFILFQGSEVARQVLNDYNNNENRQESGAGETSREEVISISDGRCASYIGDTDSEACKTFSEWAAYTKREVTEYTGEKNPDLVCADKTVLESDDGIKEIQEIFERGIPVVFMNLPDAQTVADSPQLQSLLGIYYVRATNVHAKGIHLYKGFLLGGERIYEAANDEDEKKLQDLNLDVPWYVTSPGAREFMTAIVEDKNDPAMKNQDMPALIWRTKQRDSFVYVVNGDYMDDHRIGMGILDGIVSDANDVEIYPVVNAQNLILNGFPQLTDENAETMQEVYGYNQSAFQKNIMQPGLWTMIRQTGFKPTAMIRAKYDYSGSKEPEKDTLQFYLRQLREVNGEAGISYAHTTSADIQDITDAVSELLEEESDGYSYGAACLESDDQDAVSDILKTEEGREITTILTPYDGNGRVLDIDNEGLSVQTILSDAAKHTYSEDLRLLGDESALGYSTVSIDITTALWPEKSEDQWQNLSDDAFSSIATDWRYFDAFERTTLSESDKKVRQFLSLDFAWAQTDADTLHLTTSGLSNEEADYLLRLHGREVEAVQGGTYEEVEEGTYLIKVSGGDAVIKLREAGEQ